MNSSPARSARSTGSEFGATDWLLILMTVIWGSNFSIIKYALDDFSPLSFTSLRFTLASVALMFATVIGGRGLSVERGDLKRLMILGFIGNALYQPFFIFGMELNTAGNAALILATTPVFTAIISRMRGHESFSFKGVFGLVLAVAGIVLIVLAGRTQFSLRESLLSGFLLLLSTVCWAIYTVGTRSLAHRYGATKTTALMMAFSTPILVLFSLPSLSRENWSAIRVGAWGGMVFSGLFSIALSYFIWNQGVKKLGSTRTAVYSNLTPVIAMLVAWPTLGEIPTPGQLFGAVVIFVGLYLTKKGTLDPVAENAEEEAPERPG